MFVGSVVLDRDKPISNLEPAVKRNGIFVERSGRVHHHVPLQQEQPGTTATTNACRSKAYLYRSETTCDALGLPRCLGGKGTGFHIVSWDSSTRLQ